MKHNTVLHAPDSAASPKAVEIPLVTVETKRCVTAHFSNVSSCISKVLLSTALVDVLSTTVEYILLRTTGLNHMTEHISKKLGLL